MDGERLSDGELIVFCMSLLVAGNETTRDLVSGGAVGLAGRAIAAGDYVVMLYVSGNRDTSAFGPTADRFDVARTPDPAHLAFGFSGHLCLGAGLARLEARIVFEELQTRFPECQITGEPVRLRSALINGIESLPAVLARGHAGKERT